MAASVPELLVVVLDARLTRFSEHRGDKVPANGVPDASLFPAVWDALSVLFAAHGALAADQQVALYAANARTARCLVAGACSAVDFELTKQEAVEICIEDCDGPPLITAALSQALCYVNRLRVAGGRGGRELPARLLIIEASMSEAELSAQSASLTNCAFAAQNTGVLIDCLSLGRQPSVLLRQASVLAKGKHHMLPARLEGEVFDMLVPVMLFHFLPGVTVRADLRIAKDEQHLAAVCACHGEVKEIAYVCSCCLMVACSDDVAICPTCRTRFQPTPLAERRICD